MKRLVAIFTLIGTIMLLFASTASAAIIDQAVSERKTIRAWFDQPGFVSGIERQVLQENLPGDAYMVVMNFQAADNNGQPIGEPTNQVYYSVEPFAVVTDHNVVNGFNEYRLGLAAWDLSGGSSIITVRPGQEIFQIELGGASSTNLSPVQKFTMDSNLIGIISLVSNYQQYSEVVAGQDSEPSDEPQRPGAPDNAWDVVGWLKYLVEWVIYPIEVVTWLLGKVGTAIGTIFDSSSGLVQMMRTFFDFLPPEMLAILIVGVGVAVLLRVFGR